MNIYELYRVTNVLFYLWCPELNYSSHVAFDTAFQHTYIHPLPHKTNARNSNECQIILPCSITVAYQCPFGIHTAGTILSSDICFIVRPRMSVSQTQRARGHANRAVLSTGKCSKEIYIAMEERTLVVVRRFRVGRGTRPSRAPLLWKQHGARRARPSRMITDVNRNAFITYAKMFTN